MSDIEIAIIGAGPYGLSVAAHLREAGLPFHIFGAPLESWRSFMPRGMILKSERFASSLWDPGAGSRWSAGRRRRTSQYQPYGRPLSLADFLEYGDWFRSRAVRDVTEVEVVQVAAAREGYVLDLADGTTSTARNVILATGHMAFQVSPPELSGIPRPLWMHSARLHDLGAFTGRDVTILGAGQSALETAALMHEVGARVRVLARAPALRWNGLPTDVRRPRSPRSASPSRASERAGACSRWPSPRTFRMLFPAHKRHRFVATSLGPAGSYWLRARVEGKVDVLTSHRVRAASVQDGRVRLDVEAPGGQKTGDHRPCDRRDGLQGGCRIGWASSRPRSGHRWPARRTRPRSTRPSRRRRRGSSW